MRTLIKRLLIEAYCHQWIKGTTVISLFWKFNLWEV